MESPWCLLVCPLACLGARASIRLFCCLLLSHPWGEGMKTVHPPRGRIVLLAGDVYLIHILSSWHRHRDHHHSYAATQQGYGKVWANPCIMCLLGLHKHIFHRLLPSHMGLQVELWITVKKKTVPSFLNYPVPLSALETSVFLTPVNVIWAKLNQIKYIIHVYIASHYFTYQRVSPTCKCWSLIYRSVYIYMVVYIFLTIP